MLALSQNSTFTGDISAQNMYTKSEVNELWTGTLTSSDISSARAGELLNQQLILYNVNNLLQQNTDGTFKVYDYTDPNNVFAGGVLPHPIKLIFWKSNTTAPADDNILMRLDDTYAHFAKQTSYYIDFGGMVQTNRTDETLLFTVKLPR